MATSVPSPAARPPRLGLAPHLFGSTYGGASSSPLQGAAEHGLEKIPEPIKEATALFYGKHGLTCLPGSDARGRSRERRGATV